MKIASFLLAVILSFASFATFAETVNLNKANAAALQYYLNGIGEKKAKDIIKYRKEHKKFKKIEEIKEVKGIGDATFNKIKSSLSLTKGVVSAPAKNTKKATPKKIDKDKKAPNKTK